MDDRQYIPNPLCVWYIYPTLEKCTFSSSAVMRCLGGTRQRLWERWRCHFLPPYGNEMKFHLLKWTIIFTVFFLTEHSLFVSDAGLKSPNRCKLWWGVTKFKDIYAWLVNISSKYKRCFGLLSDCLWKRTFSQRKWKLNVYFHQQKCKHKDKPP